MVNPEGKGMRCATTGYGNVIAISAAQSTHDRCVEKMRKIGYVKIPEVHVGISPDWKTNPPLYQICKGPAQEIGVRAGDQILQRAFTRRLCGGWSVRESRALCFSFRLLD